MLNIYNNYLYAFLLSFIYISLSCYDISYKKYAAVKNHEQAVMVIAYNRPAYFMRCIESLEKNKEATEIPFIFALDGGSRATQKEHLEIIKKAKLKHKIILLRERNYGCPKNHIDAYRFAFDWCAFKKIIVIQEDVVVTPTYISFMFNFHRWATKNYINIGAVQAWSYCFLSKEEKIKQKNLVAENNLYWSFVTFCMGSQAWNSIKSSIFRYECFIDQIPVTDNYEKARSKPDIWEGAEDIQKWIYNSIHGKKESINRAPRILESIYKHVFRNSFLSICLPYEDIVMGLSFYLKDLVKLRAIVNRAVHIGREGISELSAFEMDSLDDKLKLDSIEDDASIEDFQLIEELHFASSIHKMAFDINNKD